MPSSVVHRDILAKIKRANEHIDDLETLWATCGKAHPTRLCVKRDPQSGDIYCLVEDITPIPIDVSLLAGDAIQNLRTSLDYLACGMVERVDAEKVNAQTGFPIFDSETKYTHPRDGVTRKVPALDTAAMQKLHLLKPYKGGNENLWNLHRLNNIDKHRLLLTVAIDAGIRPMSVSEEAIDDAKFRTGRPSVQFLKFQGMFIDFNRPRTNVPLKIGDKLFTLAVSEMDQEAQFAIDIAINESDLLAIPLTVLLRTISAEVTRAVADFVQFL